jgi:hypothetical protein
LGLPAEQAKIILLSAYLSGLRATLGLRHLELGQGEGR